MLDIEAVAAYTNNPPCGAMRGFGVNQTSFAIEGCLDLLAKKVGIDGWEMRWRNAVRIGDVFSSGQVLDKSVGLERTLRELNVRLIVFDEQDFDAELGHATSSPRVMDGSRLGTPKVKKNVAPWSTSASAQIFQPCL